MHIRKLFFNLMCHMIPVAKYRRNLRRWFLEPRIRTLMYKKMQTQRGTISHHDTGRFIALINSYIEHGYNGQKIVLRGGGVVFADGSHRLALNLLFDYKWTYYERTENDCTYRNYGIDWFRKNGFTKSIQVKREIFKRYNLKKQMD